MKKKKPELQSIQVTVQREDRLRAINHLASAVELLAAALVETAKVEIRNCVLNTHGSTSAITIDQSNEVEKTSVHKVDL